MSSPPIRSIVDLAEYYGLRVELLDLPSNNAGFLDPQDEFIAVNRNLPQCEQVFTVAHEICHYIFDHKHPRRKYPKRWLNRQYQSKFVKLFVRQMRHILNKILPPEREADLFAMSWLVQFDSGKHLREFLDRHPEKVWLCMLVMSDALVRMPFRIGHVYLRKLFLA